MTLRICLFAILLLARLHHAVGDDSKMLQQLFHEVPEGGGTVTILPGDYAVDGRTPVYLKSNTTVIAYGAKFYFPDDLGRHPHRVMFTGENLVDFRWCGGHFTGYVFDPTRDDNAWEPQANTRAILLTTSDDGQTAHISFRDVTSEGVAGAVITVLGAPTPGSTREIDIYAKDISVENCSLQRSGKFMWDYGYLWQIMVWPEEFGAVQHAQAARYFRHDLVSGPVRMKANDDRVQFDNSPLLKITPPNNDGRDGICFFNDQLPSNIVRGRQYFVVESSPEFVRISDQPGGPPIRFASDAGPATKLISDLFLAHRALYAPTGSGPGKGALDLVGCEDVRVRGCRLSALGDTMHIQKSNNIVFSGNQISGSRMGAFFLAEFCRNAVVTGNTVDGTNGSRVMSVEKSCEDVTIVGNTFRNGGRGSWINQPRNFVLADNIFANNTTKCEPDATRGRRSFLTGDFEEYAELYFTTWEPDGRYDNVIVRGNIFTSGPHASHAITFAPGGDSLVVTANMFSGPVRTIPDAAGCTNVTVEGNHGLDARQRDSAGP